MLIEMPKDDVIHIRIDQRDKKTLGAAAKRRGLTLSSFVVETLLTEAAREPEGGEGLPGLFRTACNEAKRGGQGYTHAGRILILHALDDASDEVAGELSEIVFAVETAELADSKSRGNRGVAVDSRDGLRSRLVLLSGERRCRDGEYQAGQAGSRNGIHEIPFHLS